MAFFNPETSFVLQFISFPLEVIGLSLAAIEVRYPALAGKMAAYFHKAASAHEKGVWNGLHLNPYKPPDFELNPWVKYYWPFNKYDLEKAVRLSGHVSVALFAVLLGTFVIYLTFFSEHAWLLISVIVTSFVLAFVILLPMIGLLDRFVSRWVPDRAVGTLGILIAGAGVLGEAYQFTTQLVT